MTEFSPFSCPIFLGHLEASGCCFQSERLLYRREPNGVRAEPGKQKTQSCRTQELARSSARENEWQKKGGVPQSVRSRRRDQRASRACQSGGEDGRTGAQVAVGNSALVWTSLQGVAFEEEQRSCRLASSQRRWGSALTRFGSTSATACCQDRQERKVDSDDTARTT